MNAKYLKFQNPSKSSFTTEFLKSSDEKCSAVTKRDIFTLNFIRSCCLAKKVFQQIKSNAK